MSKRRRQSQVTLPFEGGKKRLEFEPLSIRLLKYDNMELMFVNWDVAEDFLDMLEAMENAKARDPHEEIELKEDEDYDYVELTIDHDAELAFTTFFDKKNEV